MADVHVTTWLDYESGGITYPGLVSAISNASEVTNVYVDADIDLNDELPEGITASISAPRDVYVYGNGRSIKNILCNANINNIFSGSGGSSSGYKYLYFYDMNFENVQIWTGAFCGVRIHFQRCKVSADLYNTGNSATERFCPSSGNGVDFTRCGITLNGIGGTKSPRVTIPTNSLWNNIKLTGSFDYASFPGLRSSYICGDWKQTGTSHTMSLIACVVNAGIDMAVLPTCTGSMASVINTDNLILPSGTTLDDLSPLLAQCTTTDLRSTDILQSKGLPIR